MTQVADDWKNIVCLLPRRIFVAEKSADGQLVPFKRGIDLDTMVEIVRVLRLANDTSLLDSYNQQRPISTLQV